MFDAGFIGAGHMGSALATAVAKQKAALSLYDVDAAKAQALAAELGAAATTAEEAAGSRFLFLAVKPPLIAPVAQQLRPALAAETVVVSMAAGIPLSTVCEAAGTKRCIRIMPNTSAAVGEGMILYCCGDGVTPEDEAAFLMLVCDAGRVDKLDERLFDAAAALSGCGPAYAYLFAGALADGAVACGVPRDKAALYAAQTLYGAAAMLLSSDESPETLKNDVCSPGGTTIAGVMALEEGGFRAAAANAVIAAYQKTLQLS